MGKSAMIWQKNLNVFVNLNLRMCFHEIYGMWLAK